MRINTFNFPDTFSNDCIVKMKEGPSAINQNLGLMIKCQRPQLLQNTDYGTILRKQKFKQNTKVLRNQIKDDIIRLTEAYDKRISMGNADVDVSFEGDYFEAKCKYYLKSEDSTFGFDINL